MSALQRLADSSLTSSQVREGPVAENVGATSIERMLVVCYGPTPDPALEVVQGLCGSPHFATNVPRYASSYPGEQNLWGIARMRSFRGTGASVGFTFAIAVTMAASPAKAGELLVMPYTCAVVGGQPVLTPSENKGYSVIGRREQRDFSACSPVNPDLCRKWTLYRFDLNCGGPRVPGVSVAAASGAGRRAWLEHGRLQIEMPARWSMSSDDPCARQFDDRWRPGGFARYCADKRTEAHGPIIEIPDGYAPMMGLDAIFVVEVKSNPGAASSVAGNKPPVKIAHLAQPKTMSTTETSGKNTNPSPPPLEQTKPRETTASARALDIPVSVINQPNAPMTKAQPPQQPSSTVATAPSPSSLPSPILTGNVSVSAADSGPKYEQQTAPLVTGSVASASANKVPDLRTSLTPITMAVGGLTVLGLIALTLMQWRERCQFRLKTSRDIAAVSLDGRTAARNLISTRGLIPTKWGTAAKVQKQSSSTAFSDHQSRWSNDIPQTRDEALQVLGIGVGPDVHDAAVKKLVDGLRLSWHPDHAKNVSDRELRELRMKQINAAWEIISGRRPS